MNDTQTLNINYRALEYLGFENVFNAIYTSEGVQNAARSSLSMANNAKNFANIKVRAIISDLKNIELGSINFPKTRNEAYELGLSTFFASGEYIRKNWVSMSVGIGLSLYFIGNLKSLYSLNNNLINCRKSLSFETPSLIAPSNLLTTTFAMFMQLAAVTTTTFATFAPIMSVAPETALVCCSVALLSYILSSRAISKEVNLLSAKSSEITKIIEERKTLTDKFNQTEYELKNANDLLISFENVNTRLARKIIKFEESLPKSEADYEIPEHYKGLTPTDDLLKKLSKSSSSIISRRSSSNDDLLETNPKSDEKSTVVQALRRRLIESPSKQLSR